MTLQNIDIIPDIHGDLPRLKDTLKALGYRESGCWSHDQNRQIVFLGDLIDRGSQNIACLQLVSRLVDEGLARAIMGNHELNAILYHTSDGRGGYLRPHGLKETHQHQTFLDEAPLGSEEAEWALGFMRSMPLFIEFEGLRLTHAFWGHDQIQLLKKTTIAARLPIARLREVAEESTPFGCAVKDVTGGPQVDIAEIDPRCHFHDGAGHRRTKMRYRWWPGGGTTWDDVGISLHKPYRLPEGPIPSDLARNYYPAGDPLVAFGHYQRHGDPRSQSENAICLDFPKTPCAYRFSGERRYEASRMILV